MKQWLLTILLSLLAVLAMTHLLDAETIYYVDGAFSPALGSQETTTFSGTLTFPAEYVNAGVLQLQLASEPEKVREVPFSMGLNLPGTPFQPWDTRLWAGAYEGVPVVMLAVDYQMEAGGSLLAADLEDGGGWDAWLVSFPDFPAGSISHMSSAPPVTEPAALALLGAGAIAVLSFVRHGRVC